MALTKLSTDIIDLSGNTEALTIPSGTTGPDTTDTTGTCNYPTTATALYQLNSGVGSNVPDTCTPAYNGTATSITYSAGNFGNAANFNGTSSKIDLPNFMPSGNASRSISMWVKTTQTTAATLFQYGGGNTNLLFNFRINDGGTGGGSNTIGVGFYANDFNRPATTLMDGNWHNVVTTYDSTNAKIYIDGNQTGADFATGGVNTTASAALIGSDGGSFLFNGSIDQVRLFSSALTQGQVTALYNETNVTSTGARPTSPTEGLMRENTTTGKMEFYDGSLWQEITDTASTYVSGLIPAANFNTVEYNGNGSTQDINIVGFKSDLTWIKNKVSNGNNNVVFDSIRGPGYGLRTSTVGTPNYNAGYRLTAWDDDGFSVTDISAGNYNVNGNSGWAGAGEFVAWNWKAGGAAVLNENGTRDSQVSANIAAGFSIVSYTTQSSGTATVGHGLSTPPDMIIVKTTGVDDSWRIYNSSLGADKQIFLNTTSAAGYTANQWNNTSPTNSVFSLGTDNVGSYTTIAYCWHSVAGYSKIGFYVGNGSTTGPEIYTGFKPAWLLIRRYDSGDNWLVFDNKRNTSNPRNLALIPNSDAAESVGNLGQGFSFVSTGFQVASSDSGVNASGGKYIYMTFAE